MYLAMKWFTILTFEDATAQIRYVRLSVNVFSYVARVYRVSSARVRISHVFNKKHSPSLVACIAKILFLSLRNRLPSFSMFSSCGNYKAAKIDDCWNDRNEIIGDWRFNCVKIVSFFLYKL